MRLNEFVSGTVQEQQTSFSNFINNSPSSQLEEPEVVETTAQEIKTEPTVVETATTKVPEEPKKKISITLKKKESSSTITPQETPASAMQEAPVKETPSKPINQPSFNPQFMDPEEIARMKSQPVRREASQVKPVENRRPQQSPIQQVQQQRPAQREASRPETVQPVQRPRPVEQVPQQRQRTIEPTPQQRPRPVEPTVQPVPARRPIQEVPVQSTPVARPVQQPVREQKNVVSKEELMREKQASEERALEELFKKSETPEQYRERWFDALEKARNGTAKQKKSYVFEKIARGRFTIRDDKVELLPEYDTAGKSSKDMLNDQWLPV